MRRGLERTPRRRSWSAVAATGGASRLAPTISTTEGRARDQGVDPARHGEELACRGKETTAMTLALTLAERQLPERSSRTTSRMSLAEITAAERFRAWPAAR